MNAKRAVFLMSSVLFCLFVLVGCSGMAASKDERALKLFDAPVPATSAQFPESEPSNTLVFDRELELLYAKSFSAKLYENGCAMITLRNSQRFLVVPEGQPAPLDAPDDAVILQQPLTDVLVSSTPAMSLIGAVGALDAVSMTTTDIDNWYIPAVCEAMGTGQISYIGHYTEPDYELIYTKSPSLAIFSSMLDNSPEVSEKLDELGVTVIRDLSTYEEHPLARIEWVKFYGLLFQRELEAQAIFEAQVEVVKGMAHNAPSGVTAAIFYITSKGEVYTRNSSDYIVRMLELAGGKYAFDQISPGETGIMKMEQEYFYAGAKDADFLIYIHNMGGKPANLAELVEKKETLADFKAVKNSNVWCTTPDFFQASATIGNIIADMSAMFTTGEDELAYLFRLK